MLTSLVELPSQAKSGTVSKFGLARAAEALSQLGAYTPSPKFLNVVFSRQLRRLWRKGVLAGAERGHVLSVVARIQVGRCRLRGRAPIQGSEVWTPACVPCVVACLQVEQAWALSCVLGTLVVPCSLTLCCRASCASQGARGCWRMQSAVCGCS